MFVMTGFVQKGDAIVNQCFLRLCFQEPVKSHAYFFILFHWKMSGSKKTLEAMASSH